MKTHVKFRSIAFPPNEGEEDKINPGRFGRRLAEFLVRGLKQKGLRPSEPLAEDWGWRVEIENDDFPLWIGVGNYGESQDCFLCFIEPHQEMLRPFWLLGKIDKSTRVTELQKAIDELLSTDPAINDIRWWTYEEFINRGRLV